MGDVNSTRSPRNKVADYYDWDERSNFLVSDDAILAADQLVMMQVSNDYEVAHRIQKHVQLPFWISWQ